MAKQIDFQPIDFQTGSSIDFQQDNQAPTPQQVLAQDLAKNPMTPYQNFMTGVGQGMYNLYKGVQQKGAQLGSAMGLVSPETVNQITQEGTETQKMFQPLANQSKLASMGELVGETVPTLPIPGGVAGGLLKRALTAGVAGAGMGATRFTPETPGMTQGVQTGLNTGLGFLGGFGGSLALSGLAKGYNAIAGKGTGNELTQLADKYNIPITTGEATRNPRYQAAEVLAENVPLFGTGGLRKRQNAAADEAAKGFLAKYIVDPTADNIDAANRAYSSSLYESMKSSIKDVDQLPIYATQTADKARELLANYPDVFKKFQNVKRENIINDIIADSGKGSMQPKNFQDMWTLRDGLGEMIGQAKKKLISGDVDKTTLSQLNSLYAAVNNDIDNWAQSVGKPQLRDSINAANDAYKNYVVKYNILQDAYDKASGAVGSGEIFSPKRFSTALKSSINKNDATKLFQPGEIDEMTGLANIMQAVKRGGQYMENPPTGNRVASGIAGLTGLGYSLTQGSEGWKRDAGIIGTAGAITGLLTTKAGRMYLMSASKLEPTSPAMQILINNFITKEVPRLTGAGLNSLAQENIK